MKLSNVQIITMLIFIIGFLGLFFYYNNLDKIFKNSLNLITIFGTYLSLFGIIMSFIQIYDLKAINDKTQKEVNESLKKINNILSVSELSKSLKIVDEIQSSLRANKNEVALIRMKDLKYVLIQIKHNKSLEKYTANDEYSDLLIDLSIDISNLSDNIFKPHKNINVTKVNLNLEKISTKFSELENKLKFD
ncbi:hypothetical protein [Chryseobacterium taeanense]|uniref:hypothetical protein n=1 Tax=Chryseobacterium taeanense TaxID=311334 RepID=UPI0035AE4056